MHIAHHLRIAFLAAAGIVPITLALTLPGLPGVHADSAVATSSAISPQQVAETLDSIVQPRFQKNLGAFGVDRIALGLHYPTYNLFTTTPAERRKLRRAYSARRPFAIAFLHSSQWLGAGAYGKGNGAVDRSHEAFSLVAAGSTPKSSEEIYNWSDKHLTAVVNPSLARLQKGSNLETVDGNWVVVMRPVRALHSSCLKCHAGAKHGDTLGVMVYAIDKNVKPQEPRSLHVAPGV